jgi:hypothetical protein
MIDKETVKGLDRRCFVCGDDDFTNLELHHKTPRYLGGLDTRTNLIFLCKKCHGELHTTIRKTKRNNANARDFLGVLTSMKLRKMPLKNVAKVMEEINKSEGFEAYFSNGSELILENKQWQLTQEKTKY